MVLYVIYINVCSYWNRLCNLITNKTTDWGIKLQDSFPEAVIKDWKVTDSLGVKRMEFVLRP
jgi:hypothetical protein